MQHPVFECRSDRKQYRKQKTMQPYWYKVDHEVSSFASLKVAQLQQSAGLLADVVFAWDVEGLVCVCCRVTAGTVPTCMYHGHTHFALFDESPTSARDRGLGGRSHVSDISAKGTL
eukprot:1062533-Amphidinium_carterae.1